MTDLAVRVVLKADGSGLIGQLKLSAAELAEFKLRASNAGTGAADLGAGAAQAASGAATLATNAGRAGAAVNDMGRSSATAQTAVLSLATVEEKLEAILQATLAAVTANVGANDRLGDKLIETAAATRVVASATEALSSAEKVAEGQAEQLGEELTHLSAAAKAAAAAQATAAAAVGASVNAGRSNTASLGQQRAAYANLGYQIQDITSTLALGINPLVVLAQQGGQTAAAVAAMGGRFAGVASYIAGPWGSIILAAASVLGTLAVGFFSAGDGADDLASRQSALASYLDRTTGKIKEQVNALSLLYTVRDTQAAAGEQNTAYNKARRGFTDALGQEAGRTYLATPSERGFFGGSIPFLPQSVSAGGRRLLTELEALAKAGEPAVNIINRLNAAAAQDASLKNAATVVGQLGRNVSETAEPLNKSILLLARLAVAGGTATAAQKRLVASSTEGASADLSLAEARAKLTAATDGVDKAQSQLNLTRIQGRAAVKAGTLTEAAYEAQVAAGEQAVNRAQAAEQSAREGRTALRKETTAHNKEVREAEQLNRALEASYDRLSKRLDPLAFNMREYEVRLREIAALQASGKIGFGDVVELNYAAGQDKAEADAKALSDRLQAIFRQVGVDSDGGLRKALDEGIFGPEGVEVAGERLKDAAYEATQVLRQEGLDAIQAVANTIKETIGGAFGSAAGGLLSALTGSGKAGGLAGILLGGQPSGNPLTDPADFKAGMDEVFAPLRAALAKLTGSLDGAFGDGGTFSKTLGRVLGGAVLGGSVASAVGGSKLGGSIGGALGGELGKEFLSKGLASISSSLGAAAGPIGSILGGVIGGSLGGLFQKTKSGAVTITSADEAGAVRGNSSSAKKAASGLADSVQASLNSIAEQLGGDLGSFNVTVGQRNGDYRVTTGTSLKKKKGAQDFDDDANAALAAAVRIAITQGAITGLSAAMQKAIQSSPDVDKALAEALKVQEVEGLIGGLGSALLQVFQGVEKSAAERVRIATTYGLDLVKVEEANAKQRADAVTKVMQEKLSSVTGLLNDLAFGDLTEGSPADRRNRLLDEIAKARASAEAGEDGAADTLVSLQRRLLDTSREGFGTAGPEYAADRASTVATLERVQAIETNRINAAQDEARRLTAAVQTGNALASAGNALADEGNSALAQMAATLSAMRETLATLGAGGAAGIDLTSVARAPNL